MSAPLVTQHAMRMRHVILSPAACPPVPRSPTLPHKLLCFRGGVTEHETCVLIPSIILSEIFLILRRIQ